MAWAWHLALVPLAGLVSWLAVGRVLLWLRRRAILDTPNARSAHSVPIPRGGGLGLMIALLPALGALWLTQQAPTWAPIGVLCAALILVAISWRDDRHTLGALPRLVTHVLAAAIAMLALPADAHILQGLVPLWADRVFGGLALVYFINIFNFMDGIDGISGVETLSVGAGAALVAWLGHSPSIAPAEGLILAAVAVGWLRWNWHPAKLFLGDVGSVPLGFLLGWLLLRLAAGGAWAAALVIPAYYLGDASLTLLRRTLRGEKPWEAHREHVYQRATQRGLSHQQVCLSILLCNLGLIALALAGEQWHWAIGLAGGGALTIGFTAFLYGRERHRSP